MRALFESQLTPFTSALRSLRTWDAATIHQSRVGSRRLRELIPLLGIDPKTQRRVARQLRQVTRRLGKLRELDVLASTLADFRRAGHWLRGVEYLSQTVAGETRHTRDWLNRRLGTREIDRLVTRLEEVGDELSRREATRRAATAVRPSIQQSAVDARVARRAQRLNAAIVKTGALYSPEALHRVRIAVKKLRYALEMAHDTANRDHSSTIALLKQAQNGLGRLHDLEVFIGRARAAQLDAGFDLLADLQALAGEADAQCRELHAEFMQYRSSLIAAIDALSQPPSSNARASRHSVFPIQQFLRR